MLHGDHDDSGDGMIVALGFGLAAWFLIIWLVRWLLGA